MSKILILLTVGMLIIGCESKKDASSIVSTDHEDYYNEKHRPQFHFSPEANWMNDPNGMVYYENEYHLFYQYYPDSTVWGPMHWGHAISSDLVSWEHLPIALYPDSLGLIFSGSAVVDWKNSSGLGENGKPPLVAMFTHHLMEGEKSGTKNYQYQSLTYSNDKGRTWTKYAGNPVIPNTDNINDFRDTKVIWSEEYNKWILVFSTYGHTMFWTSDNLIDWAHKSDFGEGIGGHDGVWECPDFFPMTVEGSDEEKWVLIQSLNPGGPNGGSGTQYFVGDFDGTEFTMDPSFAKKVNATEGVWLDYGRDNYAGVTWSDLPADDGRRIFLGWMSNWEYAQVVPTEKWRSANTIPRSLHLVKSSEGDYRVESRPIEELKKLRSKEAVLSAESVEESLVLYDSEDGVVLAELEMEIDLKESTATDFYLVLSNANGEKYKLRYNVEKNSLTSDRSASGAEFGQESFYSRNAIIPRFSNDNGFKIHAFIDASSIEVFVDNGSTVITEIFFPTDDFTKIELVSMNGVLHFKGGNVYPLKSIW